MSNKFTLQALALTGILAISGLPALAADMTPATPAPNAAVQGTVKSDAKVAPLDKKDSKDIHNDTKVKDGKDQRTELKVNKDQKQQAKIPAAATPAPAANASGSVGTSVQH